MSYQKYTIYIHTFTTVYIDKVNAVKDASAVTQGLADQLYPVSGVHFLKVGLQKLKTTLVT